jgi:3-oxoadipate enol-lactonase
MPANQTVSEPLDRIGYDVPPLPPGRSVTLPGRGTMFVRDSGGPAEAPVVMLLHGLGATASLNWFTAIPALEERFRVVAPDHRGHGRGIRSDASFTLEAAADDVVALADALHIERFLAVGYSMGGPIAQLVWRRHPERISGLVLCATSYRFRESAREHAMFAALPALEHIQRVLPDAAARRVIAQISRSYFADTGYSEWAKREVIRRDPRAVLQAAIALGRYSAEDWVGEIDVPTAVLVHTRDQVVPPRRQFELASSVAGAVTHFVGGDHFAVVRHPQRFVRTLVDAIDDVAFALRSSNSLRLAS